MDIQAWSLIRAMTPTRIGHGMMPGERNTSRWHCRCGTQKCDLLVSGTNLLHLLVSGTNL
jgi:hypothetical protein